MAFNEAKTAQMAARILARCGSPMDILKLMKLLYLSDRQFYDSFGSSISGDRMVSMPHGPVLPTTLNVMNGAGTRAPGGWDSWVADRSGHRISLQRGAKPTRDDLDELSDVELQVIDAVCDRYAHMDTFRLRDYTHDYCEEWVDPRGSSFPIHYRKLFEALGKEQAEVEELAQAAEEDDRIDRLFSRL